MYDTVGPMDKAYDPLKVEEGWYEWWESNGVFKPREGGSQKFAMVCCCRCCLSISLFSRFTAVTIASVIQALPPPNVTGALHIGHALTVAIQVCTVWV